VWWILHQRLGWTVQRPERRASERDEQAIARWVAHEWPRIKRGSRRIGLACLLRRIGRFALDRTAHGVVFASIRHILPSPRVFHVTPQLGSV
jgi:hypothetical protein